MTGLVTDVVTESATTGVSVHLGVAAVITLIVLLVVRELASASDSNRAKIISQHAVVGIVPLLIVFSVILLVKAVEVLS